ncbi:ubiquitin-conjugating enzyme e2 [Cryptosporidium xiaoi]|uniref:Ubiquitin-conjugating enzyme e2 n=1 Tax=Cryptosporidium xiaoi TaxID=659607 RepID=A0AAV9XUY0_9CRYT|nr:ubiquitin-conjugating enzyme e2 [Cryptosporidium bovis]
MDVSIIRLRKEFEDIGLPEFCLVRFNSESLIENLELYFDKKISEKNPLKYINNSEVSNNFIVALKPEEGIWKDKILQFLIKVPKEYPFKPPKVKCLNKILHPNIDNTGNVCINIIREDWKPTFTISIVICGILNLLVEPTNIDPLNQFASYLFESRFSLFIAINRVLYK